jgi:hypothetical protein
MLDAYQTASCPTAGFGSLAGATRHRAGARDSWVTGGGGPPHPARTRQSTIAKSFVISHPPLTFSAGALAITQSDATHDGYLSSTDWSTFNAKEPAITAGTTSQYWRGDKTWQTLDKAAVGLGNVENTALSTWAGSTNLITLGVVTNGTWQATAVAVLYGGTGSTTASGARTNLGLAVGTDVQAYDAGLASLTAADASAGLPYVSAANTWTPATYTAMLSVVSGAWKVIGWRESGGQDLTNGAIADGQLMARVGTTVAGVNVSSTATASYVVKADASAKVDTWVSDGSTSVKGKVQFAADLGTTAATAVQASDSRMDNDFVGPRIWSSMGSTGGTAPAFYGTGRFGSIQISGIYGTEVNEAGLPCTQIGDAAVGAPKAYSQLASWRSDNGTTELYFIFKLGSDISTGTQSYWMGFTSTITMTSADPSGHRAAIRFVSGTDTNWMLGTKDNVTAANVSTGVAVTARYYYIVKLLMTASTASVKIGRGSTLALAKTDYLTAATTSAASNLPTSTVDMSAFFGINRTSPGVNQGIKLAVAYAATDF